MKNLRGKILSLFMVFVITVFTFSPFTNVHAVTAIINVETNSLSPTVDTVSSDTVLSTYIDEKKSAFLNALSEYDITAIESDLQYYFTYDEGRELYSYYVFDHIQGNTVYCKNYIVNKITGTPITSATISINRPIIGSTISSTYFDNLTPSGANYKVVGNFITSFDDETEVTGTITAGNYYIVFWLEPKSGYYFTDDYTLTINGALEQKHNLGRHYVKVAAKQWTGRDVYIDNTIDNSKSYVTGVIKVKDLKTGEVTEEKIYNQEFAVTYSNPKPSQVATMINDAKEKLIEEAKKYDVNFDESSITISDSTGKVWDNRKYATVEDGDTVLMGDSDYLTGAYGIPTEFNYTRTHIASGDYGKYTYYRLEATVETSSNEETTTASYEVIEGANQTYTVNEDETAIFRINADYSLFENGGKVYVDGALVGSENYTSKSGSTIITFTKEYMSSLSEGEHTLKVAFNNNGTATTKFIVEKEECTTNINTVKSNNPQTGDNIIMISTIFVISMLGSFITLKLNKNHIVRKH